MLSLAGARVLGWRPSKAGARGLATKSSTSPTLFWKHSHAATTTQYTAPLPETSHGVSSEVIAKMRRLRWEAPKTFTAKRLSSNFHLPRETVNAVAPYHHPGTQVRCCILCAWQANKTDFETATLQLDYERNLQY
jgi:hypothetical protein